MPLSASRVSKVAAGIQDVANQLATLKYLIDQVLAYNSNQAIVWGTVDGTVVTVDSHGNLTGFDFSPAAVSNAIFSLQQIQNVLMNQAITQGDHLGNLNQLANPSG